MDGDWYWCLMEKNHYNHGIWLAIGWHPTICWDINGRSPINSDWPYFFSGVNLQQLCELAARRMSTLTRMPRLWQATRLAKTLRLEAANDSTNQLQPINIGLFFGGQHIGKKMINLDEAWNSWGNVQRKPISMAISANVFLLHWHSPYWL